MKKANALSKTIPCMLIVFVMAAAFVFGVAFIDTQKSRVFADDTSFELKNLKATEGDGPGNYTFNITLEKVKEKKPDLSAGQKTEKFFKDNGKAVSALARTSIKSISNWVKKGATADHVANSYNILKDTTLLVTSVFGGNAIASTAFDILAGLSSIGESQQSELAALESRLNKQFDEVHNHLDEVQKDISDLSMKVDDNAKQILASINTATESAYAREQVSEFFSSGSGNFNYRQFNSFVSGSTDARKNPDYYLQAYYQRLLEVLSNPYSTDEDVRTAYNDLYRSLMSTAMGDSNINKLYSYLLGDSVGNSIIDYYYVYTRENREHFGNDVQADAILMLMDMCRTAYMADACINMCGMYFANCLFEEYGEKLYTAPESCWYRYGSHDNEKINFAQITAFPDAMAEREEDLNRQYVSDIAFILNMKNSYTVRDTNDDFWYANYNTDNYGNVLTGQTIYLNKISDELCAEDYLDVSKSDIAYVIFDAKGKRIKEIDGFFKVTGDLPSDFIVGVFYKQTTELFTINFHVDSTSGYSGGSGSKNDPYLISNASQLKNVEMDKQTYYKLIRDIDISSVSPLGSELYKFQGVLDGNYHTVSGFNFTGADNGALFRFIGDKGVVKNLTMKSFNVDVKKSQGLKIYAAALCSVCEGKITNCHLVNSTVKNDRDELDGTNDNINNAITVYTGGLVGLLRKKGSVSYCSVTGSTLTGILRLAYDSNPDGQNKTFNYIGGAVGRMEGSASVSYVRVTASTSVEAESASFVTKNFSTRYPSVTRAAGGVVGSHKAGTLSDLESNAVVKEGYLYAINNGWLFAFSSYANTKDYRDQYVGEFNFGDKPEEEAAKREAYKGGGFSFATKPQYTFAYSSSTNQSEDFPGYTVSQVYGYGDATLNTDGLLINGASKYAVLGYYGLDTRASDIENDYEGTMTVLIANDDAVGYVNIPYVVKKAMPSELKVQLPDSYPEIYSFFHSDTDTWYVEYFDGEKMFDVNRRESIGDIDHGERAVLVYQNGYEQDVTDKVRADKQGRYYYKTVAGEQVPVYDVYADPGRTVTYVTYGGFTASYTAYVHCEHEYQTSQVAATCYSVGYTLHTCVKCGYSYLDKLIPLTDEHDYVLTGEKAPTCTEEGYTGDLVCSHCHKVKPGGYGDEICALGHAYDAEHADEHEHECTRCGQHKEEHFWVYAESGAYMIKTCAICGYNTATLKDLTTVPRVIVSSAYALPDSTVTVFVQLLNNSEALGITSVSFGVKFDERLTLVDWRQGDLLGNAVYNFTVLSDVTYFTAGSADGKAEVNNGNLVKLIFKTPEHAAVGDVFKIYVTDSRSTSRFTDGSGSSTDIICFGGEVTVTDRLPGDVNFDGLVDIWDAVLVSAWCNNVGGVSDEQLAAAGFDEAYGDVNFDGVVNTEDMVRILRYLVGGFNSQLIGDKFNMVLNFNDGVTPARTFTVNKGDKYSVFGVPSREGYRFDGWFRAAEGGEPVVIGDVIVFDNKQFQSTQQQVLYAHWTLNTVAYETGEGVGQIPYATYNNCGSEDGLYAVNSTLTKEYLISFIENIGETTNVKDVTITVGLKGWATQAGGEVVYGTDHVFDLKTSDPSVASGAVTLYPVWETQTVTLPEVVKDARTGYFIEYWFENKDGTGRKHYTLEEYPVTSDFAFYASWKEMTYYLNYDGNGADPTSDIPDAGTEPLSYFTEYTIPDVTPRKGIFRFFGWSLDKNATAAQLRIGDKISAPAFVTANEQVVCLYAVWEVYVYSQDGTTLYFGTYPQDRVTDDALLTALNGKVGTLPTAENVGDWTAYDVKDGYNGPNDFMWYKDVYHRGTAYRAVYFTKNKYEFGHSTNYVSNAVEHGYTPNVVYWFVFRPIEWKVLTKSDGKALLYGTKILDSHCFNDSGQTGAYEHNGGTGYSNNYALSDVRKWLTGTFYNAAFSATDKTIIQLTNVDNSPKSANPKRNQYEINGGQNDYCCENTNDYVFLLSVSELTDTSYGFSAYHDVVKVGNDYLLDGEDPVRKRRSTDYALCMGSSDNEENQSGWMLTRSPAYDDGEQIFGIFSWGAVSTGMGTIYYSCGVVPALWIKL